MIEHDIFIPTIIQKKGMIILKKVLLLTSLLCVLLLSQVAFAADNSTLPSLLHKPVQKIGVVIIGSADVKTPDFLDAITDTLSPSKAEEKKYVLISGTEVQGKYQKYWADKSFLDEQPLTKDAALDFVKYSDYDKVLFILIKDPVVDKAERGLGLLWGEETVSRAAIEVKAYLADENSIIKTVDVSKEDNSATSDLRAKRSAFKKDMKEIASEAKPYFYKNPSEN